jgi:hypothetical protein
MDMEEHMSKELLEKQQQKESLIVRFGNEVKWIFPPPAETWGFRCLWRMSDPKLYVKVYGGAPSIESRQSRRIYTYITESIRQPSHAFLYDVDAYSRALMLAAVWNDGHVLETWNCRHYFNPYTLRLHPIPSDSIGPTSIAERGLFPRRRFDPLLNNETYRQVTATEQYRDSLERNFAHVTSCLSQVPEVTRTVQNHFPNDEAIDLSPVIDSNVQALSTHLRGYLAQSTTAVDARDHLCVARKADGVIEVYNLTFDNVSIVEVVVDGRPQAITSAIIDGGQSQARPIVIPPRGASRHNPGILRVAGAGAKEAEVAILATINGTTRAYDCGQILVEPQYTVYADPGWGGDPPPMPRSQLNLISDHVHARHFEDGRLDFYNLVTEPVVVQRICVDGKAIAIKPFVVPGYLYGDYTPKSIRSDLLGLYDGRLTVETSFADTVRVTQLDSTLISDSLVNPLLADTDEDLAFLERNGSGGWRVRKGDWDVDAPLVVSGSLDIGEGTTLRFAETAYLVVKGALSVTGTSKEPVAFMPQGRTWRGIYVVSAPKRSILSNVIITDTTATEDGLLALTGGVTFYRSDVEFNNVKLTGTSAEDALNIVHSAFELNEVEVDQAASDGIDFDFATGTVANSLFQNIGGDALDFSGSRVDLDGVRIQGVRDKAVSAGEASHVKVRDLVVSDCGVALASKDGSTIDGVGVRIDAFKLYAAMCFRKKNFYGKPVLTIDNLRVNGGEEKFFRQIGADMIINGVAIGASQRDIDALYRTGPMKK